MRTPTRWIDNVSTGIFVLAILLLGSSGPAAADDMTLEGIGEIGGGLFFPTGSDADAAGTSPAIHLSAIVGVSPHWGFEAEYGWVPINMDTDAFFPASPDSFHIDASQMTLMGGLRFSTGYLLEARSRTVGYVSMRMGIARLKTAATELVGGDGWIARDRSAAGFLSASSSEVGFILSPKAGVMFRVGEKTAVDVALQQVSILDQGEVNSHFYLTVSFAMAALQQF